MWEQLLLAVGLALIGYLLFKHIKGHPQAFSADHLSKSAYVLAWLALGLIGFIGLCLMILKHGG